MYERAWAAGFFEGEGCITRYLSGPKGTGVVYQYPKLEVASTDWDSLKRFMDAVGCGNINGPVKDSRKDSYKPKWKWSIAGFEKVQQVICLLWPGLGERRRARAVEVLTMRPIGRINMNEASEVR